MSNASYCNSNLSAVYSNNGNVLFGSSVCCVGNKLLHFLTAAHNRNALVLSECYNVAAVTADKKLNFHNIYSFLFKP